MSLITTPSQTVGPFLRIGFAPLTVDTLATGDAEGPALTLSGRVTDGEQRPVTDSAVEIWQANAHGEYPGARGDGKRPPEGTFRGFGRVLTDAQGEFRFQTIKPGVVPGPGGVMQAPHLSVTLLMRGLLRHLYTRVYFADEPRNDVDPILQAVPPQRRATLLARRLPGSGAGGAWEWNIALQGANETVFFDW